MAERQYCKIFRGITLCKFKKKKMEDRQLCKYLEE